MFGELSAHEPSIPVQKDCASWRDQVPINAALDLPSSSKANHPSAVEDGTHINLQDPAFPIPNASHAQEAEDEDSALNIIALPPFLETRRHADLMVAFVNCQRLERRAEGRLIARRLKRIGVERELFSDLAHRSAKRRRVADDNATFQRVMLRYSGLFPADENFVTDMANDEDSEVTSQG